MMDYWLLMADPESYGFDQLEKEPRAVWDGIKGSLAQKHMRSIRKGDSALVYHTAPDKAVVGMARVLSEPYADPKDSEGKRVVVDLRASGRLKSPVSLAALKGNKKLQGMTFMKIQRVAVSPMTEEEFEEICRMGGSKP